MVFKNYCSIDLFTYEKAIGFVFKKLTFMKILPKFFECRFIIDSLFLFLIKMHAFTQAFIFLDKFSYKSYLKIICLYMSF